MNLIYCEASGGQDAPCPNPEKECGDCQFFNRNPQATEQPVQSDEPNVFLCFRCLFKMEPGKALLNTPDFGVPDFPGQKDMRGQTFTMTGPARMIEVWKCPQCGHSIGKA